MDLSRIQNVLNAFMILSFLIFAGLAGLVLIADAPLTIPTISLPFSFLFLSATTLIVTGQIDERPKLVRKYIRDWIIICVLGIVISALAFTFS